MAFKIINSLTLMLILLIVVNTSNTLKERADTIETYLRFAEIEHQVTNSD